MKPAGRRKNLPAFISRIALIAALCSIPVVQSGCSSLTPYDSQYAGSNKAYLVKGLQKPHAIPDSWWDIEGSVEQGNFSRVKYHDLYDKNFYMVVEGQVGLSPKKYPVILDTGASRSVILEQALVSAHKLPTYPQDSDITNSNGNSFGRCYLPELNIGGATLSDLPALYVKPKFSLNPFELLFPKDKTVIVGLQALMKFKYIMFDSTLKEAEFSNNGSFEPENPNDWKQYSFEIEEDFAGNAFLYVTVPLAGREVALQLDTGNGRGLALKEQLWEKMPGAIKAIKLAGGKDLYPYIGNLECKRGVIPNLKIGETIVSNAMVSVFPDDSPLLDECEGLLGMQFFKDTTIVLDFERNLMWIKSTSERT